MRTQSVLLAAIVLSALLSSFYCSDDDKQICVKCTAVCSGTSSSSMEECGDEASVSGQEAAFRTEHPGCEVNCARQ